MDPDQIFLLAHYSNNSLPAINPLATPWTEGLPGVTSSHLDYSILSKPSSISSNYELQNSQARLSGALWGHTESS